jgi:hypothetical protein
MLPEAHPLIEKVTEPLADNAERRMAAHAFLGEKFDAAHPGMAEATARIEAAGRRKFPLVRKALPWVLAALVLAAAVYSWLPTIRWMTQVLNTLSSYSSTGFGRVWPPPPAVGLYKKGQSSLWDGFYEKGFLEKKRTLRLFFDHPAHFDEYVHAFVSERQSLPPDFLETAAHMAPENAYFIYYAAGRVGAECLNHKKITDPAAFEEAMALIAKAAALSNYETYTDCNLNARGHVLPADFKHDLIKAFGYAYGGSSGMIQLRNISDLLCARAEQLSKSGRKEEFLALAKQREAFIAHLGRNLDLNLASELIYASIAMDTAKNFESAADLLGLTEMAETYRKQAEALQVEKDLRDIREKKGKNYAFSMDKATHLHLRHTMTTFEREVMSMPPISADDFELMRRAEHELVGGLGLLAIALSIALAALLVFLFRFVFTPMIRVPAKRMAGTLGMADWAWVIGLGVVMPILLFLQITRLTPQGGREYGLLHFQMAFPGVQYVALLLALLIAPAMAVRWRLGKILAPFGFGDRFTVSTAYCVVIVLLPWSQQALIFVERFGMEQRLTLAALAAPPTLCLCLLFANALRAILGKPAARLAQCATALAVLPAYPIAIILLCALTPIYSAGEKRWLAQETLLRIDPDVPLDALDVLKFTAQKRKEINAITGVK